ncbi:hypothetical protein MML48_2g00006967 [Holotrichia oblita]|uniref:Uncharacterized protein n=1 Tax=Holotrichia oblita TaxID=644536 RepID=A0ACB9TIV9_HOLOL|nr:hypothetical protein MML48_2g00006967 [Holotrichia oblita]
MSGVENRRKRPTFDNVKKYIEEFPDLYYDGAKIICKICDRALFCWHKSDCRKHATSIQHTNRKYNVPSRDPFILDVLPMWLVCGLPLRVVDKPEFRNFWEKYIPNRELPSRATLHSYLPFVREDYENQIKAVVKDKRLWLSVDHTMDRQQNSIVHVIVRVLDPTKANFPILLASKRLKKCNSVTITKVVLDALELFQISINQLLMFVSDGAATMRSVAHSLNQKGAQFLHLTCKSHDLHLVEQTIRELYPEVDALIGSTRKVFFKSPKRIREFRKRCRGVPEPSQDGSILTRHGTWLKTALYYSEYFEELKRVVLRFDPDEAAAIEESQIRFRDASVEADLKTIYDNYSGLLAAIETFQNTALSLAESVQIVSDVHALLCAASDVNNMCVVEKFEEIINKDADFNRLIRIGGGANAQSIDPLFTYKDYFNYACLTSVDVERSFSKYKDIYSSRRTQFSEKNLETYLMLQTYQQSYSISAN